MDDLVKQIRGSFPAQAARYLDTPSMGVPPRTTVAAVEEATRAWGQASAHFEEWDRVRENCRHLAAEELGEAAENIGMVPSIVPAVAYVAEQLAPRGGVLLAHRSEFRSILLPLMQAFGSDRVRWVDGPYSARTFTEALDNDVTAVAVSSVSSHDGARPHLDELAKASQSVGAHLIVDATQSAGITRLGIETDATAAVVTAGYKGLLAPRGTGYALLHPAISEAIPAASSPYGMADTPQVGSYGPPLAPRLGGARLDQSPAWLSWVGAHASLEFLASFPLVRREEYVLNLAGSLRERFEEAEFSLPPTDLPSPIVAIPARDPEPVLAALERVGVRASARRGVVRFGFHIYVEPEVVDLVHDIVLCHRDRF